MSGPLHTANTVQTGQQLVYVVICVWASWEVWEKEDGLFAGKYKYNM